MGNFLALSAVIGKTKTEVADSLANYARSVSGGLQQEDSRSGIQNCCIVEEANGNTSVLYPDDYLEWDDSSEFISRELHAPVFSFHIHDSDFWMYILYHDGEIKDRFNPIPDYWDDALSEKEMNRWKGNPQAIAKYISHINVNDIQKYLVRWDPDEEDPSKAYPADEFEREEWQLLDFMRKLKLPYPIDENGNPKGQTFQLWTKQLPLETQAQNSKQQGRNKPWWKFW